MPKLPECTARNALQGHTNSFLVGIVQSFNNYRSETAQDKNKPLPRLY